MTLIAFMRCSPEIQCIGKKDGTINAEKGDVHHITTLFPRTVLSSQRWSGYRQYV
ncbi:hypothetical protein Xedl_03820 [Xenorhabdus eapokensis]|uniref:Uncharacterized protein n=1 Tax=Xenorhabdus eapokensis TaxID=1873482 RepID=A0A1Q5TEL6_9GAMM|nr:hypothetical protein Xedl_03820 [Xenorhabdus eapokensis]